MKYLKLTTVLLLFLFVNDYSSQSTENLLKNLVDSTFQANPESVGLMLHVESPDLNMSWSYARGNSNKNEKAYIEVSQPALIASNTKTFVSVAILRLVEQGKITLDHSISELISAASKEKLQHDDYKLQDITIKHLLSHTSGIHDYVDDNYFQYVNENPYHKWTRNDQIDRAMSYGSPLWLPGEDFKYADVNYLLLTEIIENITEKSFYQAIRELIGYEKLGMNSTWFVDLETKPENTPKLVHQYWSKYDWDSYEINPSWDLYGGGGIVSTVKDLALFYQNLFSGKIIENPEVLKQIHTHVLPPEKSKYCLGLMNIQFNGMEAYYHGGFWGTDVIYIPEINTTISNFTLQKEFRDLNSEMGIKIVEILKNYDEEFEEILEIADDENNDINDDAYPYELLKPNDATKLLILFPGGGASIQSTKNDFKIVEPAMKNGVAVLIIGLNNKIWVEDEDCELLLNQIRKVMLKEGLSRDSIYIGGMSIGGNVALSLSNYLIKSNNDIKPKGVFIVDSPIDLYALYQGAIKDVANPDFTEERKGEPRFIVKYFEDKFDGKDKLLGNIQKKSPFTLVTKNYTNISYLKDIKFNLYTEPDADWWMENRQTEFDNTNAYLIQELHLLLVTNDWKNVQLIETKDKGYRANGERHPHSWSIIDIEELLKWMKD